MECKAARINYAAVIAESTERLPVNVECDKRAVSVSIGAGRAGDKERHVDYLDLLGAVVRKIAHPAAVQMDSPDCSSPNVTATAAFADKRTFRPSTSATRPKSIK
jgi:hypothetical protein